MNPESLKQKLAASGIPAKLQGEDVFLRKIGARDGIELGKLVNGMPRNELNQPVDPADMATFYAFALSKSLTLPSGELPFDSDDGRRALELVPRDELVPLSEQALLVSGFAADPEAAKKNLTTTNCSSPTSAEHSESSTPTT